MIDAFGRLFDANPIPMWVVDRETLRFLEVNDAAVSQYGWTREEFRAMRVNQLTPAGDIARDEAAVATPNDTSRSAGRWRHRTRDGSVLTVEVTAHRVDWRGRAATLVVSRDVTEDQRAHLEAARLADAVDAAELAIITTTPSGEVTGWNRAAHRLFGYSANEVLGRPAARIAPPDQQRRVDRMFRVVAAGRRVDHFEMPARTRDGRSIAIRMSISPLRGNGRRILGLSAVAQDITARRSLEDQLRQAQKMEAIGRLAGGIAHDFNNLLTAIGGYAQLLRDSLEPDDDRRTDADEIVRASARASDLTRQLLAFSRRQVLSATVVSLNEVVADMQPMLERLMGGSVSLVVGLVPDAGHVRVDRSQLEQVILNLAINGRDAMPGGGNLLIETAAVELDEAYASMHADVEPGPYAVLAVSDQGPGISPEARDRLFEPFFTTKSDGGGTGLGLATVYGIVHQSGGSVSPYSEIGLGTTFRVYLPQVAEPPAAVPSRAPRGPVPVMAAATILVVDDERPVRELIRSILSASGHRVLVAESGSDALVLSLDEEGPIDLLVTDVAMPGLSGPELVERIRVRRPDLPVIYVSGYPGDGIPQDRSSRFLPKPFAPDDLLRRVHETLQAPVAVEAGERD